MLRLPLLATAWILVGCAGGGPGDTATDTEATSAGGSSVAEDLPTSSDPGEPTGSSGLAFVCPTLVDGFVGVPYHADFQAVGGAPPYEWYAYGLPPGLTVEGTDDDLAHVTGVPTEAGVFEVSLEVHDAPNTMMSAQDCGSLTIHEPLAFDTTRMLAAFPDGCVPLGVGLEDLRVANILHGGDDAPINCQLDPSRGNGSFALLDDTPIMPPGISIDPNSCVVSGPLKTDLPFGIYAFIVTYTQNGFNAFVPYCAAQEVRPPTAYEVVREDTGVAATLKPGLQLLDPSGNEPIAYGSDVPDPRLIVSDGEGDGACKGNTCFYAFAFAYNALSLSAMVSSSPNSKFPAEGFEGFTHGMHLVDGDSTTLALLAARPFVVNIRFDYCIADNQDDCGNNAQDAEARAELIRMNGGGSNYYFSLVVLPEP